MNKPFIEFFAKEEFGGGVTRILIDVTDIKMIQEESQGCILYFFSQDKQIQRITDKYDSVINRLKNYN